MASGEVNAKRYKSLVLLHWRISARVGRSLMEKPNGSNSTEALLSRVRERPEMRFLTRDGETRTLLRRRGELELAMVVDARWVTGSEAPLPTVMGGEHGRGWGIGSYRHCRTCGRMPRCQSTTLRPADQMVERPQWPAQRAWPSGSRRRWREPPVVHRKLKLEDQRSRPDWPECQGADRERQCRGHEMASARPEPCPSTGSGRVSIRRLEDVGWSWRADPRAHARASWSHDCCWNEAVCRGSTQEAGGGVGGAGSAVDGGWRRGPGTASGHQGVVRNGLGVLPIVVFL